MKKLIYIFVITPFFLNAQVGINTTNPQATLHVDGTFRVSQTTSTTSTKLSGFDVNGNIGEITLGTNLELDGNTLNVAGSTNSNTHVEMATITLPTGSNGEKFHNLDIQLSTTNSSKTAFLLVGRTTSYKITGISGGTDGRRIILFNIINKSLSILNEDEDSLPENRIMNLAGNHSTANQGAYEFVYSSSLQRWIMLSFRN